MNKTLDYSKYNFRIKENHKYDKNGNIVNPCYTPQCQISVLGVKMWKSVTYKKVGLICAVSVADKGRYIPHDNYNKNLHYMIYLPYKYKQKWEADRCVYLTKKSTIGIKHWKRIWFKNKEPTYKEVVCDDAQDRFSILDL